MYFTSTMILPETLNNSYKTCSSRGRKWIISYDILLLLEIPEQTNLRNNNLSRNIYVAKFITAKIL